jgi:signal transduction histidine kinase
MRYRVEAEGGRLQIVSAPGQGTCIEAVLPVQGANGRAV